MGVFLCVGLAACASDGDPLVSPITPPVQAGVARFSMATAPSDIGGVRLRIVGSGMGAAKVQGGAVILASAKAGDTLQLILSAVPTTGTFLEIPLERSTADVSLTLDEASAGRLGGYRAIAGAEVSIVRAN